MLHGPMKTVGKLLKDTTAYKYAHTEIKMHVCSHAKSTGSLYALYDTHTVYCTKTLSWSVNTPTHPSALLLTQAHTQTCTQIIKSGSVPPHRSLHQMGVIKTLYYISLIFKVTHTHKHVWSGPQTTSKDLWCLLSFKHSLNIIKLLMELICWHCCSNENTGKNYLQKRIKGWNCDETLSWHVHAHTHTQTHGRSHQTKCDSCTPIPALMTTHNTHSLTTHPLLCHLWPGQCSAAPSMLCRRSAGRAVPAGSLSVQPVDTHHTGGTEGPETHQSQTHHQTQNCTGAQ